MPTHILAQQTNTQANWQSLFCSRVVLSYRFHNLDS